MSELLKMKDLTRILKRSRTQIYEDIKAGAMPAPFNWGKSVYWHSDVIEKFMKDISGVTHG